MTLMICGKELVQLKIQVNLNIYQTQWSSNFSMIYEFELSLHVVSMYLEEHRIGPLTWRTVTSSKHYLQSSLPEKMAYSHHFGYAPHRSPTLTLFPQHFSDICKQLAFRYIMIKCLFLYKQVHTPKSLEFEDFRFSKKLFKKFK